jgi:hypothetical protein
MVDLRPQNRGDSFTRPQRGRRRFTGRELGILFVLVLATILAFLAPWVMGERLRESAESRTELIPGNPDPMALPQLEALPDLPDATTLDNKQILVEGVRAHPDRAPEMLSGGADPSGLAWWREQLPRDRQQPPVPRFFSVSGLTGGGIPLTTPFLLEGLLHGVRDVTIGPDTTWSWGLLALPAPQYLLAIIPFPRSDLAGRGISIGDEVRLVGRWGGIQQWQQDGEQRLAPVLYVRDITAAAGAGATAGGLLTSGTLPPLAHDAPVDEEALFAEIDDIPPILELRPYYYLLGKVSRSDPYISGAYADPASALQMAPQLHQRPADFRGEVFRVVGEVVATFEDQDVARDQPYGIERVLHILLFNTYIGPYEERQIDGTVTSDLKHVLQVFEVAVIGDEEPPPIGSRIAATGRFLKVRGVHVPDRDRRRGLPGGMQRQSENVYYKFFVAPDYSILPEPQKPGLVWGIAFAVATVLFMVFLAFSARSDRVVHEQRPARVRRLREGRRRLHQAGRETDGLVPGGAVEAPDPAPGDAADGDGPESSRP